MPKTNHVTVGTAYDAILLALIGVLICLVGPISKSLVLCVTILLTLSCVRLLVRESVRLLNRICRSCREPVPATFTNDLSTSRVDPEVERLKLVAADMCREEQACEARYSRCRCSLEDLIRAKSLRVQAELELSKYRVQAMSQYGG